MTPGDGQIGEQHVGLMCSRGRQLWGSFKREFARPGWSVTLLGAERWPWCSWGEGVVVFWTSAFEHSCSIFLF